VNEADRIARAYSELELRSGNRWDLRNPGNQRILAERRVLTRRLLAEMGWVPLAERTVLEVGCGGGRELAWFEELGASPSRLVGIDLLPDRIVAARRAFPDIDFREGNAEHLDFPDAGFDLVLAFTVFSSILEANMAANVAAEIVRVLRPGGALLWYDFRYDSPSNKHVRGVSERRVRVLFPSLKGRLYGITLVPPLARRLGPLTAAYPALALLPPLRSHLLGLLQKPALVRATS
jgi:ubiquinone/menaquinone biosynthesis C-methylase UbiE